MPYPPFARFATRCWLLCCCLCLMPFALGQTTTATTITATPAVLSYTYQLGTTTLPAAQNVALKSTTANLTASLSVTGDLPSNGDWVTTSIRPGTSFKLPSSITVTVTPTGLAAETTRRSSPRPHPPPAERSSDHCHYTHHRAAGVHLALQSACASRLHVHHGWNTSGQPAVPDV